MKDNLENIRSAEGKFGEWTMTKSKAGGGPPAVPNFGRDQDVNDSLNNLAISEHDNGEMSTPKWDGGSA